MVTRSASWRSKATRDGQYSHRVFRDRHEEMQRAMTPSGHSIDTPRINAYTRSSEPCGRATGDLYLISSAAELLDMHPQTLRKYERLGLVQPLRTLGQHARLHAPTSSSGCG